jgi:hypothetical protein
MECSIRSMLELANAFPKEARQASRQLAGKIISPFIEL